MASVWRKTMRYLGLVEEDDYQGGEAAEALEGGMGPGFREERNRRLDRAQSPVSVAVDEPEAIIRTIPQSRATAGTIHRAEPKRFNEARDVGERFKDGIPVIMNLQETEDAIARRLVDFASGLVFARDGKIELVANRVYLLTPRDVEVSAEERERIREGGFFNQF
jgi:cell division inhibitor SepF